MHIYLFYYLLVLFLAMLGLCYLGAFLWLRQAEATLELWCAGFLLQYFLLWQSTGSRACRLQQLWHMGSIIVAPGLQSTGSKLWHVSLAMACVWDLPRAGIKPMSPAVTGRFFTTEAPGKPCPPVSLHQSCLTGPPNSS